MSVRRTLAVTILAATSVAGTASPGRGAGTGLAPGTHERSVDSGGRARSYLVHVPAKLPEEAPVVLAFHGGGSNAEVMRRYSGLDATADAEGFVAVYPSGSGRLEGALTWNGGSCCGHARRREVDDVAFVAALLDDLGAVMRIDRRRVFATGISNGGILAYRLACELSDRIAAIAPVAASLEVTSCRPGRAVPVIHVHGTEDEFIDYGGGAGPRSITGTLFASPVASVRRLAEIDGCEGEPLRSALPDRDPEDGTRVIRESYGGCREGAAVELYTIEGGGHTWPGHGSRAAFLGRNSRDVDVNDLMWAFFEAHPMPAVRR